MTQSTVPNHVAFIIDGNRRWAKSLSLPTRKGHEAGLVNVHATDEACRSMGIRWRSYYLFSQENAKRDPDEVRYLLEAFTGLFARWTRRSGEAVHIVGDLTSPVLTDELRAASLRLLRSTHRGGSATSNVVFFLNYSGACPWQRSDSTGCLDHVPDIDLIVRTGGEKRLSGYIPPQAAFSELAFIDYHWPEFGGAHLAAVIEDFASRRRRFGGNDPVPQRSAFGGAA
jgi:undecaprenyl diphosphate synthase